MSTIKDRNGKKVAFTVKYTAEIDYADGTTATVPSDGSITIVEAQSVYNAKVPVTPPSVVDPPPPTTDYSKTARYPLFNYAWLFNNQPDGTVKTIPAVKGSIALSNKGKANPALGGAQIINKLLIMLNEPGALVEAAIKGSASINDPKDAVYGREIHLVLLKGEYFICEKFMENDISMGDLYNGIMRTSSDNDDAHEFKTIIQPWQPTYWRIRLTSNGSTDRVNCELWQNGIKQKNASGKDVLVNYLRKYYCASLGTDTNNEHVGYYEFAHSGLLSDADAYTVGNELMKTYGVGQSIQAPYATNLRLSYSGGNMTIAYDYNNPLNMPFASAKIQWTDWNYQGPTGVTFKPELNGKLTVPANFTGTVMITPVDTAGNYCGLPACLNFSN